MPSKQRTLLIDAAMLSCPLILVMAARTFFTPAPSQTGTAAAQPTPAVVPVVAAAALSPEQQKAAQWIAALPSMDGLQSPLDHPQPPPPVAQAPSVAPEPLPESAPAPAIDPLARLKLSGILGNETGGLAAINGRIYKVGDLVRPGLKLKLIDAYANMVVFEQDDGTELRLRRRQP